MEQQYYWNDYFSHLFLGEPLCMDGIEAETFRKRLESWRGYLVFAAYTGGVKGPEEICPEHRRFQKALFEQFGSQLLYLRWEQENCIGILKEVEDTDTVKASMETLATEQNGYIALSWWQQDCDRLGEQYRQVLDMIDYAVLTERRLFTAPELPEPHYDLSCRVLKSKLEYEYMKAVANREFSVAYHHLERVVAQELDQDMRSVRRLKHRLLAKTENAMEIMGVAVDDPQEKSPCRELFSATAQMSSLRLLMLAVKEIYQELDREARQRTTQEKDKPEMVLDYLELHYANSELDTTSVADACGVSRSYVSRVVNRQGGSSFVDYVNALRIGAAKELIKTTEMTVDEICGAVGFTNRWTMLRAFKRFVGMTPQNYRLYSAAK
jgi:YesN/AraC family two-component response regulator